MIGASTGVIELRGRYGVAQLRADAPADLVARLRELLGDDGAVGDPGADAVDESGDGAARDDAPGPTTPLCPDAEADAWAAAVLYAIS